MEQKITCTPKKEIRPFLVQLFLYTGITLGGVILLVLTNTSVLDKLLVAAMAVLTAAYGVYRGRQVFRTHYEISGNRIEVRKQGRSRVFSGEDIAMAYFDSNTKNMELDLKDGNIIMLVEYDNLTPLVDYLESKGVRIDYKRIALK